MCMTRFQGSYPVICEQIAFHDRFNSLPPTIQKKIEELYSVYRTDVAPILLKNLDLIKSVFEGEVFKPSDAHAFRMGMLFILQCRDNASTDEVLMRANTDVAYQYVLVSSSNNTRPVISRAYYCLFLHCLARYDKKHDFCLMEKIFTDFTDAAASEMGINLHQDLGDILRTRIDSMLIDTPAEHLTRAGIIYRTNAMCLDLIASLEGLVKIPDPLRHYLDDSDENAVIYHNQGEKKVEKLQGLLNDSLEIEKLLKGYEDFEEYCLLERMMSDQGIIVEEPEIQASEDGQDSRQIKDGQNSQDHKVKKTITPKADKKIEGNSMQSPLYPFGTCRKKYGYQIGDACCFTEATNGKGGNILIEVLYDNNIRSDDDFMLEHLRRKDPNGPMEVCSCDAGFFSMNTTHAAEEVMAIIVPSALKGTLPKPLMADFEMDSTGQAILRCPAGHAPIPGMQRYNPETRVVTAKFDKCTCEACELAGQCPANPQVRAFTVDVSQAKIDLASYVVAVDSEEYKDYACFRNGIESVPSVMRRMYGFDTLRSMNVSLRKEKIFGSGINYNVKKLTAFRLERDRSKNSKGQDCPKESKKIA